MLIKQQVDEEGDADEHVEEVTAGDAAEGDDSAAHEKVSTVIEEPSIPSPTPPTPPPQPPQDIPSTSQVQQTPPQSPQLKRRVKKLERRNKVRVLKLRMLQKVGTSQMVETSDDTVMDDESDQGRMIAEMDQDDVVVLEDDKEKDREVADKAKKIAEDAKVDENVDTQGRTAESQAEIYKIDMDHANKVLSMQEDETESAEVQEVVDVVTTAKLITEVVTTSSETVTAASTNITTAEAQVPTVTLIDAPARVVDHSRKRKEVVIRDPEEDLTTSIIIPAETKSRDKGKGILVEELKPLKKKQQIEQDEQYSREFHSKLNKDIDWDEAIDHTEAQARKNMMVYLKNVAGYKVDYFKGMSYDDICPIFERYFDSNVDFLIKSKEQLEEKENKALISINETLAEKAEKRQKLNEEVPVVDYKIIQLNNKPHYKIIRADDTHQLKISTTKPNNFSDDFLLATIGAMFEKPNIHAQIWKTRRNVHGPAKVKGWKLLESCGVQIITFTSTQLILLVKRKYPLTRFTLDQMLNVVRLEVEEESEMSLELLRFTRQQHQEGQLE
nr:hypothetical protein [Tanacetum cinerariifolium]